MFEVKPWISLITLVLSATACSSSTSSSNTQPTIQTQIVPTTLDWADKATAISILSWEFGKIDITMPSVSGNETSATLIANMSVYRERINDIKVKEIDLSGQGYNINMNSLQDYLYELVQLVDAFLNDVVYNSQSATAVSGGKLQYHLDKFEALKQCYMDLREDC